MVRNRHTPQHRSNDWTRFLVRAYADVTIDNTLVPFRRNPTPDSAIHAQIQKLGTNRAHRNTTIEAVTLISWSNATAIVARGHAAPFARWQP